MFVSLPMTDDQPLMRYLTHDKFLRLLDPQPALNAWRFLDPPPRGTILWKAPTPAEYGSLWMALPSSFSDKDEGNFPALNANDESYCDEAARHLGLSPEEAAERRQRFLSRNPASVREGIRARTQLCGVSCWYQDTDESERMWREYAPDGKGVVVLTTLKQFDEALGWTTPQYNKSANPLLATINYVDRDNFFLVNDGYYHLLTIKGEGFMHEREVRLIAKSPSLVQATAGGSSPSRENIAALVTAAGKGFNLLIDLKRLVSKIRVHPLAPGDYADKIRRLLAAKQLSPELVHPSQLP